MTKSRATWLVPQALVMPIVAPIVAILVAFVFPSGAQEVAFVVALIGAEVGTLVWLWARIHKHQAGLWIFALGFVLSLLFCLYFIFVLVMPGTT